METGLKGLFRPLRMVLAAGLMGPRYQGRRPSSLGSDTYNDWFLLLKWP